MQMVKSLNSGSIPVDQTLDSTSTLALAVSVILILVPVRLLTPCMNPVISLSPHPIGTELPPNGLPNFTVYYENNDDGRRELGDDSRLIFKAPKTGVYFVRVSDVRGFQGKEFHYDLTVRPRKPDFKVTLRGANPRVNAGSGKEIEVVAQRIDGFQGPIQVDITGVPRGLHVTSPIIIQAGHDRAYGLITADSFTGTAGNPDAVVRSQTHSRESTNPCHSHSENWRDPKNAQRQFPGKNPAIGKT